MKNYIILFLLLSAQLLFAKKNDYNLCFGKFTNLSEDILNYMSQFNENENDFYYDENTLKTLDQLLADYKNTTIYCEQINLSKLYNAEDEYYSEMFYIQYQLALACYKDKRYAEGIAIAERNIDIIEKYMDEENFNYYTDLYEYLMTYTNLAEIYDAINYTEEDKWLKYRSITKSLEKINYLSHLNEDDESIESSIEIYAKLINQLNFQNGLDLKYLHAIRSIYSYNQLCVLADFVKFLDIYFKHNNEPTNNVSYNTIALPYVILAQDLIQQNNLSEAKWYIDDFDNLLMPCTFLRTPMNLIYITYTDYYIQKQDYLNAFVYINTFAKYAYLFKNAGDLDTYNYLIDTYNLCAEKLNRADLLLEK